MDQQQQQQQAPAAVPPQPTLGRPWFRLGSMIRGDPTPAPAPAPQPTLPRPQPLLRTQTVLPGGPINPPPPTAATPFPARPTGGTASLPSSPVLRPVGGTSSVPQSPRPVARPAFGGLSSVPQSPRPATRPAIGGPSSVPPSPQPQTAPQRPAATTVNGGTIPSFGGVSSSVPPSPKDAAKPGVNGGGTASLPQSPQAKKPAATSSLPSSPQPATRGGVSSVQLPATTRGGVSSVPQSPPPQRKPTVSASIPSPKTIKTSPTPASKSPPPSPAKTTGYPVKYSPQTGIKPSSPPPPLRLPSPQLKPADHPEPEPKRLVSKAAEPSSPPPKAVVHEKHKPGPTKTEPANHYHRGFAKSNINTYSADDEEDAAGIMRVITIAGENKGAIMELLGHRRPSSASATIKKKPNSTLFFDNSNTANKEVDEKLKKVEQDIKTKSAAPMSSAFVNSNVQSVNNSILFNASCTMSSPGVHLALSTRQASGGRKVEPTTNGRHHKHHS